MHDLFTQMRPFFSVMQLRGNMLQSKRFKIYEKFSQTPRGAVLFATNVAERGLGMYSMFLSENKYVLNKNTVSFYACLQTSQKSTGWCSSIVRSN